MGKKLERKAKHGGARMPTKDNLYARSSKFSLEMLDILVDLARNAKQESVRMAAAGKVLDKALPDLKATELRNDEHSPLLIKIVEEITKTHE